MGPFIILLLIVLCWSIVLRRKRAPKAPLPPSPPSDPILGHLRYIPPENPELQYTEWAKTYGDVIYLRILNRPIIVLNSAEAALDLLEKRSGNYSDRPEFPIFEIMGWKAALTLSFAHYGKQFQKHRRLFQEYFSRQKVDRYRDLQVAQARRLAVSLVEGKKDLEDILQSFGTSIVVRIAFGQDLHLGRDPTYDQIIIGHGYAMTHCGPPGGTLVDLFPILQYLPSWFPGTFFANRAREFHAGTRKLHEYPFAQVQRQMLDGTAKPSFLSYHLERIQQEDNKGSEQDYDDVKGAAATIYAAGSETIWATLSVFMLAMVLYPQCQQQAQEELDDLLLRSRLPDLEDRKSLPYIECVVQETYRWLSVVPVGLPHRALHDDVYKGMFIPKGTIIFANGWGIQRDEAVYRDASVFNPSRYLPRSEGDNAEPFPISHFGFGRRVCPGRYLADGNFWIAAATILSLLTIERVKNEKGEDVIPSVGINSGLTSHPKPYECNVRIRDNKAKVLLDEAQAELSNNNQP